MKARTLALLVVLAASLLLAACDAFRVGNFTVRNLSRSPVLTQSSVSGCDRARSSVIKENSWRSVPAGSFETIKVLGLTKCVVIVDVNRRLIAAEPYANGRVFTVHADGSYAATALPDSSSSSGPAIRWPDFGVGSNQVLLVVTAGAILLALGFSAKFLYDYGRPVPAVVALNPAPVASPPSAGTPGGPMLPATETIPPAREPRPPSRAAIYAAALVLAVVGGVLGTAGAFVQEIQASGNPFFSVLLAFTGAPIIEEALKPLGVYIALIRWPRVIRGGWFVASLAGLGGLVFGLIESFVYVNVYNRSGGADYATFRYTVPVAIHVFASFTVGLGLSPALIDWAAGRGPLPRRARNFYLFGVGIHAAYNITVTALSLTGVLEFS